jgi:hypothetical protein
MRVIRLSPGNRRHMELTHKSLVLIVVLTAVVSSLVAYTITTLANPMNASADAQAKAAASTTDVVRQLKDLNTKIGANYKRTSLTGITADGFDEVRAAVESMCRAVAERSYSC